MTESRVIDSRPASSSPIAAVGSLVAARDLEELALAASLVPAQLFGAHETLVLLVGAGTEIVQRHPANSAGAELERWARAELGANASSRVSREGSWVAVGLEPVDGWSGVVAFSAGAVDEEATGGVAELGRIVSRCVGQIAGLKRRSAALEDTKKSIGKGLHDLRTPLNSLRLGLHLLEPGLASQDPQVVQRTHRAVDRLAALVTEMYEALHQNTEAR